MASHLSLAQTASAGEHAPSCLPRVSTGRTLHALHAVGARLVWLSTPGTGGVWVWRHLVAAQGMAPIHTQGSFLGFLCGASLLSCFPFPDPRSVQVLAPPPPTWAGPWAALTFCFLISGMG